MTIRTPIVLALNFLSIILSKNIFGQKPLDKQILWTADWSPNGEHIAIGGNVDSLKIYKHENFKIHTSIPVKNTVTRIKWHPSLNVIAVTTQLSESKSFIINLETNQKIELNSIAADGARGVDWNYTGEYLAVADNDGQILIYTIQGKLIKKISSHVNSAKSLTAIDWHPSKNIFATVGEFIFIMDIEGNLIKQIRHREQEELILSIAWHKSGDFFVTGDYGDEINKSLLQFWTEQGELIKTMDVSKGEYRNLAWNAKGSRLASASDALRIWDVKGNLIAEGYSEDYLWGVSWNKKGDKIVTSSIAQNIVLWNNKAKKIKVLE